MARAMPDTGKDSGPSFIEHRVPRGQSRIHVREYAGAGAAFVLMHGFPDNMHIYDDLIPALLAGGRRVIAFDFLGFGESDKPADAVYGFEQQLEDLRGVVGALGLGRIIPVAHDSSGPAAINYSIDNPGRVDSMCILNSFYAEAPAIRYPELIELFATTSLKTLAREILNAPEQFAWLLNFQRAQFELDLPDSQKAYYRDVLGPIIDNNFRNRPGSGPAFAQMTGRLFEELAKNTHRLDKLEQLDIPVKIIWGELDPYLNAGVAADFRSHLKRPSVHLLPAGHWVQMDMPDQVAAIMLDSPTS